VKPHTDDSDDRRTRAHARALSGRLYTKKGQVLLVRGDPDPQRLLERVAGWETPPATAPTPAELGFASSDVIPMTRGSLSTRSRSVHKWRVAVEREAAARPSAARRRELAEQTAELDALSARVADLHRLHADPTSVHASFWLTPFEESELADAARELVADRVVTPDVAWLARLIRWVGGLPVCQRFLATVRDALCFPAEHAEREAVLRFREIVLPVVGWLDIVNGMPED